MEMEHTIPSNCLSQLCDSECLFGKQSFIHQVSVQVKTAISMKIVCRTPLGKHVTMRTEVYFPETTLKKCGGSVVCAVVHTYNSITEDAADTGSLGPADYSA